MRTVRFLPEAEIEFRESTLWYYTQQQGLELEFVRCIDECLERIKHTPTLYPKVYKKLRRAVVKRFPYVVVYDFSGKEIIVFAVFHSKRDPKKFEKRN